jgi:hypothetical protein
LASFTTAGLQHETVDKIGDVLASILSVSAELAGNDTQEEIGDKSAWVKSTR